MFDWFFEFIKNNEFAGGGLLMVIAGYLGTIAYRVLPLIYNFIKRKTVLEVEIANDNILYGYISRWFSEKGFTAKSHLIQAGLLENSQSREKNYKLIYSPGIGNHFIFYKRKLFWLHKNREEMKSKNESTYFETYTIRTIGRNQKLLKQLLEEVKKYIEDINNGTSSIFTNSWGEWRMINNKELRGIDSIILNDNKENEILNDVKQFFTNKKYYDEMQIPYKRGYLLYGPPGTGKTSLVQAISKELNMNIYILNCGDDLHDNHFNMLLRDIPKKSILLFEDVDALFNKRKNKDSETISFKTFINGLDGVFSPEEVVMFLTTNHVEKLDSALIRPGRCDVKLELSHSTENQKERLFKRFYPNSNGEVKEFLNKTKDKKLTPADLQSHFMLNSESPKQALKNIDTLG